MITGIPLLLIILFSIVVIAYLSGKLKIHPFLVLLVIALLLTIITDTPANKIGEMVNDGFGNMMKKIGIIVILGTCIGTILEKSGAIQIQANLIIKLFGQKRPIAALTMVGAIIGIPIFCDSGFVILNGIAKSVSASTKRSYLAIISALASGLYITHTLLPPHPGSLSSSANFGLKEHLGTVIGIGFIVAIPVAFVAWWFNSKLKNNPPYEYDSNDAEHRMPTNHKPVWICTIPVLAPILLIALASFGMLFSLPSILQNSVAFLGQPIIALLIGFVLSLATVSKEDLLKVKDWIKESMLHSGSILVIVGAGGIFGEVLKNTALTTWVKTLVGSQNFAMTTFLLIAWALGILLKTAQGSTTSAMIVVSSILAPLCIAAGITQPVQLSLVLAAVASGSMMISHSNDAYFWVITQFGSITPENTYKSFSLATIYMSVTAIATVILLSFVFN